MPSSASLVHQCDIAIAGAGLVGLTLASLLLQQSRKTPLTIALIDQNDAPQGPDLQAQPPQFDSRVVALSPRSVEILTSIGIWSQLSNQRVCHYQHMTVWDHDGTGQIEFDARDFNQPRLGAIVENSLLTNAILASLKSHESLTFVRGQSIDNLGTTFSGLANHDLQSKCLILSDGTRVEADLIIAADGAHSTIRKQLNLPTRSWSYGHNAIVATVECENSHQHTAWQIFLPTGPLAFLPLGEVSERFCSIVWSVETEKAKALMALEEKAFRQQLTEAFERRLGAVTWIDRRYSFPLSQSHAIDYFVPQVALVGDAAHTIHPLAGQGVNLGFLDAYALAKEVSRAHRRHLTLTDISILRRYQRRRKKNNLEVMLLMETLKRLFGHNDLSVRWARNTGLNWINASRMAKRWLAKQAMGL